jgi:Prophage CP4-57 regulatory protein (AlpA)
MLVADRIVRMKTVLARAGLSRSTIYRKIADGTFPAQVDQRQWCGLAGIRHRPLDCRSRRLASYQ